ncbi:MAG TPA: class I SAM-dependent methyltransferase [Acidimicrobiales bacterium]|nr:class I SAM-dependent methyltransferase [Acidimicrobiales bacterium]
MQTTARLTGERPQQGVTPDSLLALHDAGYRAMVERLGPGRVLDVGCGQGFESVTLGGPGRTVVGVDYSADATGTAAARFGLPVARMDALALGLADRSFAAVCSSHLIEHFTDPAGHVAEMARVVADDGAVHILTPNEPADFENPFHVHLFGRRQLADLLGRYFGEVWLGGVDAVPHVKADFAARRARAQKLLKLDVLDLRHRMPRSWYIAAYTRLLPLAYRLVARGDTGGVTGITADDWFVTDDVDDTTLVLFAICKRPYRSARQGPQPLAPPMSGAPTPDRP